MFEMVMRTLDQCSVPHHLDEWKDFYADELEILKNYDKSTHPDYFKLHKAIMEKFSTKAVQCQQEKEFLCLFNRPLN